ncbi:LAQU0S08e03884g1_1 [Lachancea quebecensis]|uniref:LAQU0S08e03884g1_1 n=1 Tax=Lachancea quebecensis TaxID=1654605 RepID=A0A0P1L1P8_9SACH|nr:LAQU0S08e03884g1_1 [Lachancea quebecensis]
MLSRAFSTTAKRFENTQGDWGYLKRRLTQLKEEATLDENDALSGLIKGVDQENPSMEKLYNELPKKKFETRFRAQIQASKLKTYVNKESRETALSRPWTGEEHYTDASLRMIMDGMKNRKGSSESPRNLGFVSTVQAGREQSRYARKSAKTRIRLETAQDQIATYKIDKDGCKSDNKEASEFRALYAERFTPIGSFEKLISVADIRIEESMKKGEFDSVKKLRGQKLHASQPLPYVDRTEHHLNDILVRQNISPPWIEKQGSVTKDIVVFRDKLLSRFHSELIVALDSRGYFQAGFLSSLKPSFHNILLSLKESTFINWKSSLKISSEIEQLNRSLRSYNLQAPLPAQKFYLQVDRELQRVLKETDINRLYQVEFSRRKELRSSRKASEQLKAKSNFQFSFPKKWRIW